MGYVYAPEVKPYAIKDRKIFDFEHDEDKEVKP
jgi:hypothetical protein